MAQRHNKELVESGGVGVPTVFDDLVAASKDNPNLAPLIDGLRTRNVLASDSFLKNRIGPVGAGLGFIGGKLGGAVAVPLTLGLGTHLAAHGGEALGRAIGGTVDSALGINLPPVLRQRIRAQQYLQSRGLPSGENPLGSLRDVVSGTGQSVTGNTPDAVPVNTPIPAAPQPTLRPNTPDQVFSAMAQDDGRPPSQAPLQAAQMAAAATPPGNASAPPTSLQVPPWEAFVRNGDASIKREDILAAVRRLEDKGVLPAGQADVLEQHNGGINKPIAQAIQAELQGSGQRHQGNAVEYSQQARINAQAYISRIAQASGNLQSQGKHEAGMALLSIGAIKTKAGKRAARNSLPPDIAADIPDWAVEHGGE